MTEFVYETSCYAAPAGFLPVNTHILESSVSLGHTQSHTYTNTHTYTDLHTNTHTPTNSSKRTTYKHLHSNKDTYHTHTYRNKHTRTKTHTLTQHTNKYK